MAQKLKCYDLQPEVQLMSENPITPNEVELPIINSPFAELALD